MKKSVPASSAEKLIVAVSSRALFALESENKIYEEQGLEVYRKRQRRLVSKPLTPGPAFAFIKRLLHLNEIFTEARPVEVLLLSRNDPDTGLRVFKSIEHHKLDIKRAGFLQGSSPWPFLEAFGISLFLSANEADVREAVSEGRPAGLVLQGRLADKEEGFELRIAFDFDGVLADDEAEKIYKAKGLKAFQNHEKRLKAKPMQPGPLAPLFKKLAMLQSIEKKRRRLHKNAAPCLRLSLITARSAPAHERVVTTLKAWGVEPDEVFFLGGLAKAPILEKLQPHIFFDDQMVHLYEASRKVPSVHIPFGISNYTPVRTDVQK